MPVDTSLIPTREPLLHQSMMMLPNNELTPGMIMRAVARRRTTKERRRKVKIKTGSLDHGTTLFDSAILEQILRSFLPEFATSEILANAAMICESTSKMGSGKTSQLSMVYVQFGKSMASVMQDGNVDSSQAIQKKLKETMVGKSWY